MSLRFRTELVSPLQTSENDFPLSSLSYLNTHLPPAHLLFSLSLSLIIQKGTYTHTRTHTHACAHTHTHTHTHSLSLWVAEARVGHREASPWRPDTWSVRQWSLSTSLSLSFFLSFFLSLSFYLSLFLS